MIEENSFRNEACAQSAVQASSVNAAQNSALAKQPFIKVTDAVVVRQGRTLLTVPSFELAEGENIAILGPNGAGKSTFVKLMTREMMPLYREITPVLFRGNPRATLVEQRKALGIVSSTMQKEINLHLPALDIVAGGLTGTVGLPFSVEKTAADHARERAIAPMEMLGIRHLTDKDVTKLSTGEARRVLIARALMDDPDALIFDEPCTGLDPEGMFYVRQAMRKLAQQGKSIVLVTHYPEDIIPEIKRLLLIRDGGIFADGSKEDLLTGETIGKLFNIPVQINCTDGYYSLVADY